MSHTFLLVDGHSLAFRAFFAMPDSFRDPAGEPVHAVYGFLSILFRQISELGVTHAAVAWDEGRPFREEWYPDYKAGRQEVDPAVQAQVERLQEVLGALRIPGHAVSGWEADDVIATLVQQAHAVEALQTVVLSGDRDLFGVIGPRTTVLYPTRSMGEAERYDAARLRARWGIAPEQVADFKALVGDPSDNIPGVRGIGEKGATALLDRFGTLEEIYAQLESVTPARAQRALEAGRASAFLSQRLARLARDVPGVTFDLAACRLQFERAEVEQHFDRLGFGSLRNRLPGTDSAERRAQSGNGRRQRREGRNGGR